MANRGMSIDLQISLNAGFSAGCRGGLPRVIEADLIAPAEMGLGTQLYDIVRVIKFNQGLRKYNTLLGHRAITSAPSTMAFERKYRRSKHP